VFPGGQAVTIHRIERAGQLLVFYGVDDLQREIRSVQHFTQLIVLLLKAKSEKPTTLHPIGFSG
jgi:hypothetical protein